MELGIIAGAIVIVALVLGFRRRHTTAWRISWRLDISRQAEDETSRRGEQDAQTEGDQSR